MVAETCFVVDAVIEPAPGWEIVSGGCTARVESKTDDDVVVKVQYANRYDPEGTRAQLQREFEIYSVLPRHDRLLHLLPGSTPERLVLPYLSGGTLKNYLATSEAAMLSREQRLQLAADAAEAISVLHAHGVVHCDIQLTNFMLIGRNRLCVIDFAGSRLRDEEGTAMESTRYYLPRPDEEPSSVRTDLFALGSVLYAMFCGVPPYDGDTDDDVTRLYASGVFPSIENNICGQVVRSCWTSEHESAQQVYEAIHECLDR